MSQRRPVRIDQDGPWTVSVADSPQDARSYSLYIKTPTHNLTLTRTAFEIIELDAKLRETPNAKLPKLPIDASAIPPKRKSTFLNTLSRLASPNARGSRKASATSPSNELNDPFTDITEDDAASMIIPSPTATSTGIAAYMTTVANTPSMRSSRPFKRFIRVRTDDLESVRVERAIKRVRSDLAAHTGRSSKDKENLPTPPVPSIPDKHIVPEPPKEEKLEEVSNEQEPAHDQPVEQTEALPPPPATPPQRLHRSKSVDADSTDRLSRSFASSSSQGGAQEEGMSSSASIDGEDSSASTPDITKKKKKKKQKKEKSPRLSNRKVVVTDFEMMRVLGKGCAGKVLLVKHKNTEGLYALKAITKRHVLAHQELQHTLTEQAVLKRMAAANRDPFVVKLWWSFHDKENLFLVMDFHPGGDLATQLARWGRLGRDRARFYAAEIVEGVEGLHYAGVIYRDLKPENILIGGDGHIVLTDFGLSKEFSKPLDNVTTAPPTPGKDFYSDAGGPNGLPTTPPWMKPDKNGDTAVGWGVVSSKDSTTTFCGTAEYLAPEVIQGQAYSYEVDWWSFGTMLYEMLTGITPFWANNHSDMYVRVLQDELTFPDERALDQDTKSLIRGLLQRTPSLRICEPRIKKHPYFSMIDWSHVYYKRYIPPYIPPTDPSNASDTQNFDETFLDMEPVLDDADDEETDHTTDGSRTEDDTDGADEEARTPSQSRRNSDANGEKKKEIVEAPVEDDSVDVFDGYSFKGRHSVLIDDDDEEDSSGSEEIDSEQESAEADDVVKQHLKEATDRLEEQLGVEKEPAVAAEEEEEEEPKTPPAKPHAALPQAEEILEETREEKPTHEKKPSEPRKSKDLPRPSTDLPPPAVPAKDAANDKRLSKQPNLLPVPARHPKRKEKSGVAALDQYLSPDDGERTEMDEDDEDDDWDLIDASNIEGEERNGGRGTTLFAKGVVDKYKLTIAGFGRNRTSTPGRASRSVSAATTNTNGGSPPNSTPSTPGGSTKKRGKSQGGYSFRKPRQFLRPRSPPPSSFSPRKTSNSTPNSTPSLNASGSLNGSGTILTDSSLPSLKTKESSLSAHSSGGAGVFSDSELSASPETERTKGKKLKRVKVNAEKVFSIFSGGSSNKSTPSSSFAVITQKEKEKE